MDSIIGFGQKQRKGLHHVANQLLRTRVCRVDICSTVIAGRRRSCYVFMALSIFNQSASATTL